jgi:hypothetical protein
MKIVSLCLGLASVSLVAGVGHAERTSFSQKQAKELVGAGVSAKQMQKLETRLLKTVRSLKDTKRNHQVDASEIDAAIKRNQLTPAESKALRFVKGAGKSAMTKAGLTRKLRGFTETYSPLMEKGVLTPGALFKAWDFGSTIKFPAADSALLKAAQTE